MFVVSDANKNYSRFIVQSLKDKADQALADKNRAACERWLYQLMDLLDTMLPQNWSFRTSATIDYVVRVSGRSQFG